MYPSDLTDAEWKRIAHHFRPKDRRGSGCKHEKKHMVDAILYRMFHPRRPLELR
jgi:putative transposase